MRALPILLAAPILGGCVGAAPTDPTGVLDDVTAAGTAFALLPTGATGGEPSIGVASDGTIFLGGAIIVSADQAVAERRIFAELLRSSDGGATWEEVGNPVADPKQNMDPWMWLDPLTDRVYNVPLHLACSWAQWSDDGGETWLFNPAVACVPPSHDHQKLVTGPPAAVVTTVGYPNVVYYAYNSLLVTGTIGLLGGPRVADERLGTIVSTSLDGGLSFSPGKIIHESDCHRGIIGPPAVAPDGTVYIPHGTCEGVDIMISRDSGATWETVSLNDVGSLDDFAFDPAVAVDEAGTASLAWPGRDALLYFATSRDAGRSWSAPERLTPPEVNATVYSSAVGGAPGKFAVAYAATDASADGWTQKASSFADKGTTWHLEIAIVDEGRVSTRRLTTEEDPLQRGCIWMRGGQSECRNLLDFVTLTQREGRLFLAYTDGCDACPAGEQSTASDLMVAISEDAPLS